MLCQLKWGLHVRHYWSDPAYEQLRYSEIHKVAALWIIKQAAQDLAATFQLIK